MNPNTVLFEAIHSLTGNAFVDQSMVFLAEYLIVLIPLILVYLWFIGRDGKEDSILVFGGTLFGLIVSYAMGLFYSHQNPSAVYETISAMSPENAFPSQHTTVMFSAALPLIYRHRDRLGYLMLIAGLSTGFARVYIGEHWPVDILGAFMASLFGLAVVYLVEEYVELIEPLYVLSETIESKLKEIIPINL